MGETVGCVERVSDRERKREGGRVEQREAGSVAK